MNLTKSKYAEKLIAVAMALTPYPLLRIGLVGFPELLIILLSIYVLFKYNFTVPRLFSLFTTTFVFFILISVIGFLNTSFLGSKYSLNQEFGLFNFSAYIFVLLTCYSIEVLIFKKEISPYTTLKYIFLYTSVLLSLLYFISLFRNSLFGFPLKYGGTNRFSPFSLNMHTTALVTTILPFIGFFILKKTPKIKDRLFSTALILIIIIIGFATGVDKVPLAYVLGLTTFIFFILLNKNLFEGLYFLLIIIVVLLLNSDAIIPYFSSLFEAADGGNARFILYSSSLKTFPLSPIFGFGTASQVKLSGEYFDYHNTVLTIIMTSGVIGMILFSILFYKLFKVYRNNIIFISLLGSLTSYIVFSDVLRRPFVWCVLALIYYFTLINYKKTTLR